MTSSFSNSRKVHSRPGCPSPAAAMAMVAWFMLKQVCANVSFLDMTFHQYHVVFNKYNRNSEQKTIFLLEH